MRNRCDTGLAWHGTRTAWSRWGTVACPLRHYLIAAYTVSAATVDRQRFAVVTLWPLQEAIADPTVHTIAKLNSSQ